MDGFKELTDTYEIFEQIGAGGGGTVYRAVHKRLQKQVVLKKITGNNTNIQECRTEVDILKNLHHPYLPQVLDFIDSPEGIYTVMDFIPGKSFRQMLDEGHVFREKEVLKYTRQLCDALSYLHGQNPPIVHGDIKPDNVMVTPEGNVCLIDFNISGILEGKGAQASGYTPGFSSPEQVEGFDAARRSMRKESQKRPEAGNQNPTVMLSQGDQNPTVLLSQGDQNPTVLLSQGDQNPTVLLSQGDQNPTVLLSQGDQNPTVLLSQTGLDQPRSSHPESAGSSQPKLSQSEDAGAAVGIVIDRRSDIFSLGATLYTLLTGKVLDVRNLNIELPDISDGFAVILTKALAKDPAKRYRDAGKMLQAVLQVNKKNRRYKKLLRVQTILSAAIILLIAAGVFFTVEGVQVMESERQETYYDLVAQMEEGIGSGMEQAQFDQLFESASAMYPTYFDAYYEKACYLFQTGDYEAVTDYIRQMLDTSLEGDNELWGNLYHLYGECFFRLEDYENAAASYRTSLKYRSDDPEVYRDFAISLVYIGNVQEAAELLDQAVAEGMEQVDISMVRGELARTNGNYAEAMECFESVRQETQDEYLLQRVYVMGSKCHEDEGTEEALRQDTQWLQEGLDRLSMNNRLLLYERLAQDDITLGEMTQDTAFYEAAVEIFAQIREMGWDTYLTYSNAVVLCQRMGDLEQARQWAQEMLDQYPDHYVTYMRLAYLEVQLQNEKENQDRDYTEFDRYYQKAKECYQQQVSGNVTDAEMQLLDNTWQQVLDGGWLAQ